jgi:beta-glucosidase-like glycosyl hydrolase
MNTRKMSCLGANFIKARQAAGVAATAIHPPGQGAPTGSHQRVTAFRVFSSAGLGHVIRCAHAVYAR